MHVPSWSQGCQKLHRRHAPARVQSQVRDVEQLRCNEDQKKCRETILTLQMTFQIGWELFNLVAWILQTAQSLDANGIATDHPGTIRTGMTSSASDGNMFQLALTWLLTFWHPTWSWNLGNYCYCSEKTWLLGRTSPNSDEIWFQVLLRETWNWTLEISRLAKKRAVRAHIKISWVTLWPDQQYCCWKFAAVW